MELKYGRLNELTVEEVYNIFRLRVSVFVVEQNCPYQEIDDADKEAVHMWLEDDGEIVAYLRVIPAGLVFDQVSIGRVIAVRRRQGLATVLVKEGIKLAAKELGATEIVLEAQTYARSLYEKLGFCQISEEFLEDGIPHIKMRLEL